MWFSKPMILVIDDDSSIGNLIKVVLSGSNQYEVVYFNNGYEALNLLSKKNPALILLDWIMPEMNGIDFLKHIKTNSVTANIPVMMLRGKNLIGDIEDAFSTGANDYLIKPIDIKILKSKVKKLLSNE